MPPLRRAPTTELGGVSDVGLGVGGSWAGLSSAWFDDTETVPELMFPASVRTYSAMRTDSQVHALMLATHLPIQRYRWFIEPRGAADNVVEACSQDLGLPVETGDPPGGRWRQRFDFGQHLAWALESFELGFQFFEQVYVLDDDGHLRLRKLAPRPPSTIEDINVARDGGLVSVTQNLAGTSAIPVDRLVAYVWEPQPGSWVGRSDLRPLYKHWLIKDRLYRVDAIKHERNGVGMPIMEAPENATPAQMREYDQMAQEYKAGERGGGATPHGAKLRLVGTEGSMPDTIASIREHNEAMARAYLAMFMQLGHTESGSRALGQTFVDFFSLSLQTRGEWFRRIFTAHVIEDWVDFNFGTDEPAPALGFDPGPPELSVDALKGLIDSGALVVDANLRGWVREHYDLPESANPSEDGPTELPALPLPA